MSKIEAVVKAQEMMVNGARSFKDRGATSFPAKMHQAISGYILWKLVQKGMEPSEENFVAVFGAIQNHSAWRQKLEKEGVFAGATVKGNEYAGVLKEENGED